MPLLPNTKFPRKVSIFLDFLSFSLDLLIQCGLILTPPPERFNECGFKIYFNLWLGKAPTFYFKNFLAIHTGFWL